MSRIHRTPGKHWKTLENIGKHWKPLKNIGKRWKTVENSGKQWKSWKQMEKQMEKTWAGASGCKRCRGLHILRDPFGNVDSCVVTANKEFTTLNEERQWQTMTQAQQNWSKIKPQGVQNLLVFQLCGVSRKFGLKLVKHGEAENCGNPWNAHNNTVANLLSSPNFNFPLCPVPRTYWAPPKTLCPGEHLASRESVCLAQPSPRCEAAPMDFTKQKI